MQQKKRLDIQSFNYFWWLSFLFYIFSYYLICYHHASSLKSKVAPLGLEPRPKPTRGTRSKRVVLPIKLQGNLIIIPTICRDYCRDKSLGWKNRTSSSGVQDQYAHHYTSSQKYLYGSEDWTRTSNLTAPNGVISQLIYCTILLPRCQRT